MANPVAQTVGQIARSAIKFAPVIGPSLGVFVYQRLRQYFADTVDHPTEGSVVYHSMGFEQIEHSGVYIGGYNIVSLDKNGDIVQQAPREFLKGSASNKLIYISCKGKSAIGDPEVAARAREMVGEHLHYNVALNNCHRFTYRCLTGDFDNKGNSLTTENFFTFLQGTAKDVLGADTWRIWDREKEIQRICGKAVQEIAQNRAHLERLLKADFDERERLLKCSFDQLKGSYGIEDINGFLNGLAEIAPDLPWEDFKAFDDWMCDDETALDLK